MGLFVDADEVKARAQLESIKAMDTEAIEDVLIAPAEALMDQAFHLDMDTDADPRLWASYFDNHPGRRTAFRQDYRRALHLIVNRLAANPDGYGSQSVMNSSVTFGKLIPEGARALMQKWGQPRRLFRV